MKCGTTSLFTYLLRHPAVAGASRKEVKFFDRYYGRGELWYRGHFPPTRFGRTVEREQAFAPAVGEATTGYLFHPHAPARVQALDPGMRLIAILRDPVDRTFSHYHHCRRDGRERLPLEEALAAEPRRLAGELEQMLVDPYYDSYRRRAFSYVARGHYLEQLNAWLEYFPREQLLVLATEDLRRDPGGTVDEALRFLGVSSGSGDDFPHLNSSEYEQMPAAMRERLAKEFDEPNRRLYDFLGRDLRWTVPAVATVGER